MLSFGLMSSVSTLARAGMPYEVDLENEAQDIDDLCAEGVSTVVDYVTKTEAQWLNTNPTLSSLMMTDKATGTPRFTDTSPTFKGWLFDGRTDSPLFAVVTPAMTGLGPRVLRYAPDPADPTVRVVALCEYKRKDGKWSFARGGNYISQPANSIGGVVRSTFPQQSDIVPPSNSITSRLKRMWKGEDATPRVFAAFTKVFHFANHSYIGKPFGKLLRFTLTLEPVAPQAPASPAASNGAVIVNPNVKSPIPPNVVTKLLQPTDQSQKGPYAAWDNGKFVGAIPLYVIGGAPGKSAKLVSTKTVPAFLRMVEAARKDGVELNINSGFRSYGEQEYLFDCYKNNGKPGHKDCNGGNLAGEPGSSNHQSGEALDIEVGMGKGNARSDVSKWTPVYRWLVEHGRTFGFKRTVEKECWHWEYRPESAKDDATFGSWAALKAAK